MQKGFKNILLFFLPFLLACGAKDNGAQLRLESARKALLEKDYVRAKLDIDSLKILYPKSFAQIKASLSLLDTVRRAENNKIIADCDSLISLYEPDLQKMKSMFTYQINKKYQDEGRYIPKEYYSGGLIANTTLQTGVKDDGAIYLESVFVGGKQKHNRMKVTAKDGLFVESGVVTDDGLNYRSSSLEMSFEIIHFSGASENGVAKFIYTNKEKPLTITLQGQQNNSYSLPQSAKSAISKSYQLSEMMLQLDSLKTAKEKAEFHIYYLDNKKEGEALTVVE